MGSLPLCSVLTPTRNRRRFIPRLVAQFLEQTHGNKELILINGGEPIDDLLPLGYGYMIRIIDHKSEAPNAAARIGEALNLGVRAAYGEYCFRFDDDDLQSPERITRQLALFQMTGKSVVAGSSTLYMVEGSKEVFEYAGEPWGCVGLSHAFRRDYALAHPYPESDTGRCEDIAFAREAYERGELCSISGADWVIGMDHPDGNTGGRLANPETRELLLLSDNYRQVSQGRASAILTRPSGQFKGA